MVGLETNNADAAVKVPAPAAAKGNSEKGSKIAARARELKAQKRNAHRRRLRSAHTKG